MSVGVCVGVSCVNKNFNTGHNLNTCNTRGRAFIFHMGIPCHKTFHAVSYFFHIVTLTLNFDLLLKNFNMGYYIFVFSD